jgi:hypothetical protein
LISLQTSKEELPFTVADSRGSAKVLNHAVGDDGQGNERKNAQGHKIDPIVKDKF